MIGTSLTIKTTFNTANAVPNIKVQDITDYVTEGIALADVKGILTLKDPTGNTFHTAPAFTSPDIDPTISRVFSIALPLDVNDAVIVGSYTVTYEIQVGGGVQPGNYTTIKVYNFCFTTPTVEMKHDIDCLCATLKDIDNTNYGTLATSGNTPNIPILGVTATNTFIFEGNESSLFIEEKEFISENNSNSNNNGTFTVFSSTYDDGSDKTGTITTSLSSTAVVGVGTLFTTELSVGQTIYDINGILIGKVASITNNLNLVLAANALVLVSAGEYISSSKTTVTIVENTLVVAGTFGDIIYQNFIRIHSLFFPKPILPVQPSDIISSDAIITVNDPNFYSGIYGDEISTIATYTQADGLNVVVLIEGGGQFEANCDWDLCSIFCGIKKLVTRWNNKLRTNPTEANQILNEQLIIVMFNMMLFRQAQECGDSVTAASVLSTIVQVGGFTSDCQCGSGTIRRIVPVCGSGGSGTTITISQGNGIKVSFSGSNYQISLDPTILNKINSLYNTNIISSDSTISVSGPVTSGITKTFDIKLPSGSVPQNRSEFISNIQYGVASITAMSVTDVLKSGANMVPATPKVDIVSLNGSPAWLNSSTFFVVYDFQFTPTDTFKITASVINSNYLQSLCYNGKFEISFVKKYKTVDNPGQMYFMILYNGIPVSNAFLCQQSVDAGVAGLSSLIKIHFKISQ